MISRNELRIQLREQRNSLSPTIRTRNDELIYHHLKHSQIISNRQHIAIYLSCDGEVNHQRFIKHLWNIGRLVYLPVLNGKSLSFYNYLPDTSLVNNHLGIPEPNQEQAMLIQNHLLDLVIMPLTGFDQKGNRLGMGGGYYDRSFAFMKQEKRLRKPFLLGSAYECQEMKEIPVDKYDVPMSGIVTEAGLKSFSDE